MTNKIVCAPAVVPLRVPVVALTDALDYLLCGYSIASRAVTSRVRLRGYILYPLRENYLLCEYLSLFAIRKALLSLAPIPRGFHRPSSGADVTLIAICFPVYP